MQNEYKIAVIGGTGKSGRFLVKHLLNKGISIRMLIRSSSSSQEPNPLIEFVSGDARDPETVLRLVEGSDAVISTLGQPKDQPPIFSDATGNIIRAMDILKIRRYILITGLNVDTPFDKKSESTASATKWMKVNYPKTTADKQREWEMLTSSDLDWTLVRLPLIDLTEQESEIKISLEDCPGEKISASSLARFLVSQLEDISYLKQSPFIANR